MRKTISMGVISLVLYATLIPSFTNYLKNKPVVEKMGYVPTVNVFKSIAVDQKEMVAASLVMKVMMYFGGQMQKSNPTVQIPPDYRSMSRLLHGAVKLDPYNMDAYYFAQAFLTWDVKQYKIANELLDYGMKYRTWDWYLPFFAGFNSSYFLHDFKKAAEYYKRAGDLSGQDLHKALAGRFMQASGQTELAIIYLSAMEKGERNPAMKKTYQIRLAAFKGARKIEIARDRFKDERGSIPENVAQLLASGYLAKLPTDPYGGEFYLLPDGSVSSTSKFAFGTKNKETTQNSGASK